MKIVKLSSFGFLSKTLFHFGLFRQMLGINIFFVIQKFVKNVFNWNLNTAVSDFV